MSTNEACEADSQTLSCSECARLLGLDPNSFRIRASQYKVESLLVRAAKAESFMLLSPSRAQVDRQAAVEATPVIKDPKSGFYKWPMAVLDFRSMYPSIIAGDNLCYSTCLGAVRDRNRVQDFGVTDYEPQPGVIAAFRAKNALTVSPGPSGLIFVRRRVRRGLLGRLLDELIEGRERVKARMKGLDRKPALLKLYDTRQAALKFVTSVSGLVAYHEPRSGS